MELFKIGFVPVRLLDIIDISIVALLIVKLYTWVKGTISFRIFAAFILIFLFWRLVDLLDLVLLKSILDQFIGVGTIAMIVLFAPEIRRFLIILGRNTLIDRILRGSSTRPEDSDTIHRIIDAVIELQKENIGALIILTLEDELERIQETGTSLNSEIHPRLIHAVFQLNSPLHDGAMLIANNKIAAAGCILPVTHNQSLSAELGLRHRSGIGITEVTTALAIIISEERSEISIALDGHLYRNLEAFSLEKMLIDHYKFETT